MSLIECEHGIVAVAPNGDATCNICGDRVEMESVVSAPGEKPFFWKKSKPSERAAGHPANRPHEFREVRPDHYEPI